MRPIQKIISIAAADPNGVAEAQTPADGDPLVLDGVLVTDGVATFIYPTQVTLTSGDDLSTVTFTVYGLVLNADGTQTQGVNTATTLWCCAAVGVLCGLSRWPEALFASVVIVLANTVLRNLAHKLNLKMGFNDYLTENAQLDVECSAQIDHQVQACMDLFLKGHNCQLRNFSHQTLSSGEHKFSYKIAFEHDHPEQEFAHLGKELRAMGVTKVEWHR